MNASRSAAPSVLVFDVNETLLDFEALTPLFERVFDDPRVLREWMGHLFMYSMASTASGLYVDFFTLGQGVLRMVAAIRGGHISSADLNDLKAGMLTLPAYSDVESGLTMLREQGFRLATLTNSPPNRDGPSPVEHAGLGHFFEWQLSVAACGAFKPATEVYRYAARQLDVPPATCMMVAAHVWDTMGAQSAGFTSALITRPGNAPLPVSALPQPTVVAADLPELARALAGDDRHA